MTNTGKYSKYGETKFWIYPKYIYRTYRESGFVSEMRLQGLWLHDWGFRIGEFIKVKKINKGVLIIKNT